MHCIRWGHGQWRKKKVLMARVREGRAYLEEVEKRALKSSLFICSQTEIVKRSLLSMSFIF